MRKLLLLQLLIHTVLILPLLSQSFSADFQPYITRPGDVHQIKALPDGRFMAAGAFSLANGAPEANVARFFADGSLDFSFQSTVDFSVTAMAIQPDGKIVIGGSYNDAAAPEGITVLRLNTDGSLDESFQAGFAPSGTIEDIEIEFNGTILVGGAFNSFAGQVAKGLARLAPEGFLLQTIILEEVGTVFISDLIVLGNGRFYVGGSYQAEGYLSFRKYSGLPADGFDFTPDFPGVNNIMVGIRDIELDSQGRIVMTVGTFLIRYALVIINPDGSMADWGYTYGIPMDLAVDAFDNILIAGEYEGVNAVHRFVPGQDLIVYQGGSGCDGLIRQLEVASNGAYLIGGSFSNFNGATALSLERLDGFGNPISSFNPTLERPGVVRATAIVDDKIYIGGDFAMIDNHYSPNLARLHLSTGEADQSFSNPGLSYRNTINHLAMDGQNRIVLAGTNEFDGDSPEESPIVRVLPSGELDASFVPNPLPVGTVYKVIPIPGGLTLAAGDFTIFNPDIIASQAALFTQNGTHFTNFSERLDATLVTSAFRQSDGKIILAGKEISYDNSTPQPLLRLSAAFEVDQGFQPDPSLACESGCRYTFYEQADGKLLIGGNVLSGSGAGLLRLNNNGSPDPGFAVSEDFRPLDGFLDGSPRSIRRFPDGRLLVVGLFDSLGIQPSSGLATFADDGTLLESFPGLRFNRQNLFDAQVIDDETFLLSGVLANIEEDDYRSVARVDYVPPVPSSISGRIDAWWGPAITNVELGLLGPSSGNTLSSTDGEYTFSNVEGGGNYEVLPMLNTEHLNGVSTLDLILISRHILGIEYLPSPYQIIAADVNKSNSVTILDMARIRSIILGMSTEFSDNTSWRFVPSNHVFSQPSNPWLVPFSESYTISSLVAPGPDDVNFKGIKTGDVSGDAETDNFQTDIESRQHWEVHTPEQHFKAGEAIEVPFTTPAPNGLLGFQFTISFSPDALEVIGIKHGLTTEDNFGWQYSGQGLITVSWNQWDAFKTNASPHFFTLKLRARKGGTLSEYLQLSSAYTAAEAYFAPLSIRRPVLHYDEQEQAGLSVMEAHPNPFTTQTRLPFLLPEAGLARLNCYNTQGQLIHQAEDQFPAGHNAWILERANLAEGLIIFTIDFGKEQVKGKLIVQ